MHLLFVCSVASIICFIAFRQIFLVSMLLFGDWMLFYVYFFFWAFALISSMDGILLGSDLSIAWWMNEWNLNECFVPRIRVRNDDTLGLSHDNPCILHMLPISSCCKSSFIFCFFPHSLLAVYLCIFIYSCIALWPPTPYGPSYIGKKGVGFQVWTN